MSKNNKKDVIEDKPQNKGGLKWKPYFMLSIVLFSALFVGCTVKNDFAVIKVEDYQCKDKNNVSLNCVSCSYDEYRYCEWITSIDLVKRCKCM